MGGGRKRGIRKGKRDYREWEEREEERTVAFKRLSTSILRSR